MNLIAEPLPWLLFIGLVTLLAYPVLKIGFYKLNVGADEYITNDQRQREIKRTALVDIAVGRALQMHPKALQAYGRRNWQSLLSQEQEIISQVRETLQDSHKVRFLQEAGELETLCQPLFALKAAKHYSAKDGRYRDRRRREIQKGALLALRKQLIDHYGLSTGSRRRGLLAGLDLNQLPAPHRDGRR